MKVLALDTATELCSAALWLDGQVQSRQDSRPRGHGELILPMIETLLGDGGVTLRELDAIAFGRGPGAFTGVRLAVSVAQGLGFAAGVPLIAISDLQAVAMQGLLDHAATDRILVCQDARMNEVYWGCFQRSQSGCTLVTTEAVAGAARVRLPTAWKGLDVIGAGSGFGTYKDDLAAVSQELSTIHPGMLPRAQEIAQLAAAVGCDGAVAAEDARPVYLRDEVVSLPNQAVTSGRSSN